MASKEIRLHAYQIARIKRPISEIKRQFTLKGDEQEIAERIKQNIKPISESHYVIVLDELNEAPSNFVCGRFIKLRESVLPLIINTRTAIERSIKLEGNESVEEVSHFVWNVSDCVLFGEYNHYGARYFTYRLEEYLNTAFGSTGIDVSTVQYIETEKDAQREHSRADIDVSKPAPDVNTKERFEIQKSSAKRFRIKLTQFGLNKLIKDYNLSAADQLNWPDLFDLSNECTVELIFRPRRTKNARLNLDKIKKLIGLLIKDDDVEAHEVTKLDVKTADSFYNLIGDNLLEYDTKVNLENGTIPESYRPILYADMKSIYLGHIKEIKNALRPCPQ